VLGKSFGPPQFRSARGALGARVVLPVADGDVDVLVDWLGAEAAPDGAGAGAGIGLGWA